MTSLVCWCVVASSLNSVSRRLVLGGAAAVVQQQPMLPPPVVTSPPCSLRRYRALELPSGLRVLLAQCAWSPRSEVAATVSAGQLRDTSGYDGLCHLTEHLTMARGRVEQRVAAIDGAGYANAFTGFDRTTFFATCEEGDVEDLLRVLGDALRRSAVFDAITTTREIDRVEAEHRAAAAQEASIALLGRGGRGSRASLLPLGRSVRDVARAAERLYDQRYDAAGATLAVVAPAPLDDLERMATRAFDKSLAVGTPAPLKRQQRRLFDSSTAQRNKSTSFSWKVPYDAVGGWDVWSRCKPDVVVAHLLGHHGPNTLASEIVKLSPPKKPGAPVVHAATVVAGDQETGFAVFEVRVSSTDDGKDVERLVRDALLALRSPDLLESAASDCAMLAESLAWNCPPREPSAVELANDMRDCVDPSDYLSSPRRIRAPPAEVAAATRRFVDCLVADASTTQTSSLYQGWRPSAYVSTAYGPTHEWSRLQKLDACWYAPGMWHLTTGSPRLVRVTTPLASVTAWLPSPVIDLTDADAGRAWQLYVERALAEPLYDAVLAGHKYELAFYKDDDGRPGVRVALAGFADTLPRFAVDYATRLRNLATTDPVILIDGEASARDVRRVRAKVWSSLNVPDSAVLVAGHLGPDDATALADDLLVALTGSLPRERQTPRPEQLRVDDGVPPPELRLLLRRAFWDHPVAGNLGLASGVPALVPGAQPYPRA